MQRGHVLGHAVVLEHVQQGRLARVVQAEEEQLSRLLPEAEIAQHAGEPVPNEHDADLIVKLAAMRNK